MILLEMLMAGLEVGVEPFAVCDVRDDRHLALPPNPNATVHYTLAGSGVVRVAGGPAIDVRPHTFMVMPPGVRQSIEPAGGASREARPDAVCEPVHEGLQRITAGCGKRGVVMACGAIRATYRERAGLFDYLREPIVENFADDRLIRGTFEALLGELAAPQPGTSALAEAVMKQCLVLLLRRHCASGECQVVWLSALDDPRLGPAVAAMLDTPEAPHTLEKLADISGMSRSAFAEHFSQAFGRPAMDFLKEVRLRRAAKILRNSSLPVKVVARSVGYSSRSYFSRAFKALHGIDPAAFRTSRPELPGR